MKVLSGVYPHGTYEGEIVFDGKPVEFSNIRQSEAAGIVIIHQELALIPELSIAENIFLGNETASGGVINWDEANHRAIELLARVGLRREPADPGQAPRRRQAAAGRDRQGAVARRSSSSSSTSRPPP